MKKTILVVAVICMSFISITSFAQQTWDAKKNPTVDSIVSHYSGKYVAPRPSLTLNDIFPVIGKYESSNAEAASLTITLDEQNKGVVWVNGLPQGMVKAMLRKSPAIYKIPAQKTADGKDLAEGTLIFDKETNTLNIVIGKNYNAEDPSSVFNIPDVAPEMKEATTKVSKSKTKTKKPAEPKPWVYSGTKISVETVSN